MGETWWHEEELLDKNPELKEDLINTCIGMRAVMGLDKDTGFRLASMNEDKTKERIVKSYLNALNKSGIHAYCKRLCDFEEYRLPESLIAILQYEFQANMLLNKTDVPVSIKRYVKYVSSLIGNFRKRWNIEAFEDTDLKMGWQLQCIKCRKWYFSDTIDFICSCGLETEVNEICTIPIYSEFKGGQIVSNSSFCPSNGSEAKAIASVKKLLGVKHD